MITEILDSGEESHEGSDRTVARDRWRRKAVTATSPLFLVGGIGGATSLAQAPHQSPISPPAQSTPGTVPTATPCPTPRGFTSASAAEASVPSILLANHQPCHHHESMATAFRWL